MKENLSEDEEDEISGLEMEIAEACEDENRNKIVDNFKELNGNSGNVDHQGVWKTKRKCFPKIKPSLPVGKKNWRNDMITNPDSLKDLYLDTFKYRLRKRPVKPGFESYLKIQEELFESRLKEAKGNKSPPWRMEDLEKALKKLKTGK